jgi:hypothetical protein
VDKKYKMPAIARSETTSGKMIATTFGNFLRTRKSTTGRSKVANNTENSSGSITSFPT